MPDLTHAHQVAARYVENIIEETQALKAVWGKEGKEQEADDALRAITEQPLSIQVGSVRRHEWFDAGRKQEFATDDNGEQVPLNEYEILLATGGPAVRIVGKLNKWGEPETARIQGQDWFTPWVTLPKVSRKGKRALLDYARTFYFGEG